MYKAYSGTISVGPSHFRFYTFAQKSQRLFAAPGKLRFFFAINHRVHGNFGFFNGTQTPLPLYSFSTSGRQMMVTPLFSATISSSKSHGEEVNVTCGTNPASAHRCKI